MKSIILISLCLIAAATSCKKKGCTDTLATNYDPKAQVDDGSCTYPVVPCDPVTDARDGQTYPVVKIGDQCWMAKNMNYETSDSSWCHSNNPANCDTYGRLYNKNRAIEACPDGWHVPTKAEWDELVTFLGGASVAGPKMSVGGSSGFEGKLGGYFNWLSGTFVHGGGTGRWWTTTLGSFGGYWDISITADTLYWWDRSAEYHGYSCRCVKD